MSAVRLLWLWLWGVALLLLVAGCRSETPEVNTPAPTIAAPPFQAAPVDLTTLVRNPATFSGRHLQLSGQYSPLPPLVCQAETHRSPATWVLTNGEVKVLIAGFEGALRRLADEGMVLTVEGRWDRWEGLVGCGRRPPTQEVWYLEVTAILAPNPLVQALPEGTAVAQGPAPSTATASPEASTVPTVGAEPTEELVPSPTQASGPGSPTPMQTPPQQPTATAAAPTATPTPTEAVAGNPTPTTEGGGTGPTATPTVTATAGASATPSTTPSPTATATTATQATPPPTNQGVIDYDDFRVQALTAANGHLWGFSAEVGEAATVSAATDINLDLKLEILDPNGQVIVSRNQGGIGQPETSDQVNITTAGVYQIVLSAVGATSGNYALVLLNSDSVPFVVFRGNLTNGSSETGSLPADIDELWQFSGTTGQDITVVITDVTAGGGSDLVLYLLGPDGLELEFVDANGPGEGETLADFTLPADGLYSVGVGELEFDPADYTLTFQQS